MNAKERYDKKVRTTRVFLADYLALKRISQVAGVSMAEALHKLIEHQAQLPLLDMQVRPAPAVQVTGIPAPAFRNAPVTAIATNGNKGAAFRIKLKGARYA